MIISLMKLFLWSKPILLKATSKLELTYHLRYLEVISYLKNRAQPYNLFTINHGVIYISLKRWSKILSIEEFSMFAPFSIDCVDIEAVLFSSSVPVGVKSPSF